MPSLVYNQQTSVDPALTAPDAHGVNVSGAIGQGLQEVGQAGVRIASDMNRLEYAQKEADGVAQLQKNISDGYRNFTTSIDGWKQDPAVVQQNGAGLTKQFVGSYGTWQDQLIEQQPTPRLKRMAAEQARTMGDHFFNQSHSWEVETNRAWRVSSFDESINTDAATIQQNPEAYAELQKNKLDALDALRDLHPQDHLSLSNKVRATYAEAAALGHAQKAPQDTVNILTGAQPLQPGGIPQKIVAAAQAKGVDPKIALAFAQFESRMKPEAQNGKSTGLFQVQPDTGAMYGVTDLKNPDENIKAGIGYLADNQRAFKDTFRRDPSVAELYSMHLLGTGGGMALTKASNDTPFADVAKSLYGAKADQVQSANHLSNMTVGQVKAQLAGWMAKATADTAGLANAPPPGEVPRETPGDMPDYFKRLTPQGRQAILTHAQSLLRKDDSEARSLVRQNDMDTTAAYQRGQAVDNPPTLQSRIAAGIPYREAVVQQRTLDSWQQFGSQYAQFKTLPPEQGAALLKQNEPVPGMPGYAAAAEAHDAAIKAFEYVNTQRSADPAHYDQTDGLHTTQPLDLAKPDAFTVQMHNRYAQAYEVAKNSGTSYGDALYSKQEAFQIGEQLTGADAKTALQNLSLMRASASSQDEFNAAILRIAKDHPMLASAGQLAMTNPQAAYTVLQGERMLHPKDGKKADLLLPSTEKFRAQWELDRGAAYPNALAQTSEADKQAAIAYYVARQSPGARNDKVIDPTLWGEALNAVSPSTPYNDRQTLVPAGSDPTKFADHVAQRWDATLQAHGLAPLDYPRQSYQLTSAGQDGVYTAIQGTTPLMVNGKPFVLDMNAPMPTAPALPKTDRPLKGRVLTLDDMKRFR